jgi:hypothetical protein
LVITSTVVTAAATTTGVVATTSLAACQVAPYFKIAAIEAGDMSGAPPLGPQYLYDPMSNDDDKLQFSPDISVGAIFSLSPTGQLEFSVTDLWGTQVILLSDQDAHVCHIRSIFRLLLINFVECW